MSTTSERIRAAALGPAPIGAHWAITSWLQDDDARRWALRFAEGDKDWYGSRVSQTVRRMFLLFVAEAAHERA